MMPLITRRALQKKGVLSEAALPEELRLALAQNMQNDLFYQVRGGMVRARIARE